MAKISIKNHDTYGESKILILDNKESISYPIPFTEWKRVKVGLGISFTFNDSDEPPSGTITSANYQETMGDRLFCGFAQGFNNKYPLSGGKPFFGIIGLSSNYTTLSSAQTADNYINNLQCHIIENDGSFLVGRGTTSNTSRWFFPDRDEILSISTNDNFQCHFYEIERSKNSNNVLYPWNYIFRWSGSSYIGTSSSSDASLSGFKSTFDNTSASNSYSIDYQKEINFDSFYLYNPCTRLRIRIHCFLIEKIS